MKTFKEYAEIQSRCVVFADIAAQHRKHDWKKELAAIGYELIAELNTGEGVDGFICSSDSADTSAIVFCGTQPSDPVDSLIDIQFSLVPCDAGGMVHFGVLKAYRSVRELIESLRPQLKTNVFITGHSLGGGMSQMCHALSFRDNPFAYSVSFAGLKIGNKDFWDSLYCKDNMLKLVYHNDIVPRIPYLAMGYHEPELNIWMHGNVSEKITFCEPFDQYNMLTNMVFDHPFKNYLRMSKAILNHTRGTV